ncbi:Glutathione synthetase [Microbotryomycetes sp. JL201]|nr:Glutathione synthetase [Microbotryomycetes sp. JL201]
MTSTLPPWPPTLSADSLNSLLELATDYAIANGVVYRPPAEARASSPSTTSAIHAPYSLLPSPFPQQLYNRALELQPLYNALYAHVTVADDFLKTVVGQTVARVDDFQRRLYQIWTQVVHDGIKQPLHLGLFRSDYLIDAPTSAGLATAGNATIKQVEFNTISASFGCLATKVADLHRHVWPYLALTGAYPDVPELQPSRIPRNQALQGLAAGLAAAHRAYGQDSARVLMITQDNERNAFDQRPLEYELLQTHAVRMLRIPLSSLRTSLRLSPSGQLLLQHSHSSPDPIEISVVYWRTGYAPTDYYTENEWNTRLLVERSLAIKCPTIALQLAGCKKVQQVLAEPGELDRFVDRGSTFSQLQPPPIACLDRASHKPLLESSFTNLYPMDDTELGKQALRLAYTMPDRFVLKPQREGGGNNIYRSDIPRALDEMARRDEEAEGQAHSGDASRPKEREGFILMDLINPPDAQSIMVKAGEGKGVVSDVISELGVYGVCLFKSGGANGGAEVLVNETVGSLLRTKGKDSNEGGVAVGFSVIDSVTLI